MEFVGIKYNGWKQYKDRTPLRNVWAPGAQKLIPEKDAKALLRFPEFTKVESEATEAEVTVAKTAQVAVDEQNKQEEQTREAILDLIETMDKDALATYAAKYDAVLDKRKKAPALRLEVANLVDQFGAR
jgi:hypothetical protein